MLDIRRVPADHPDAVAMIAAVQQVYVELYGGGDLTPVDAGDFDPPRGCFLVGYLHGQAVAGGGWRAWGPTVDPPLREGDAEIKRMYVVAAHRGRGFARAVLAELERAAAAAGCLRTVLETGRANPRPSPSTRARATRRSPRSASTASIPAATASPRCCRPPTRPHRPSRQATCLVGSLAVPIYALGDLEPSIHPDAYVHPDAVVIGAVTIGAQSSVWPSAVLRGDDGRIVVGARTSIQDGTVVHCTPMQDTVIGDEVTVGHNVHIESATIGDRALISSGSVVLNGATVEQGAVVAAGAVVSPNATIPARRMALGVPARVREGHEVPAGATAYAVASYVERGKRFRAELRLLEG